MKSVVKESTSAYRSDLTANDTFFHLFFCLCFSGFDGMALLLQLTTVVVVGMTWPAAHLSFFVCIWRSWRTMKRENEIHMPFIRGVWKKGFYIHPFTFPHFHLTMGQEGQKGQGGASKINDDGEWRRRFIFHISTLHVVLSMYFSRVIVDTGLVKEAFSLLWFLLFLSLSTAQAPILLLFEEDGSFRSQWSFLLPPLISLR